MNVMKKIHRPSSKCTFAAKHEKHSVFIIIEPIGSPQN
jgi:hypothetical protein